MLSPQIGPAVCSPSPGGEHTAAAGGPGCAPPLLGWALAETPPALRAQGELLGQSQLLLPGKDGGFLPARMHCCSPRKSSSPRGSNFPSTWEMRRARRDSPRTPSLLVGGQRRALDGGSPTPFLMAQPEQNRMQAAAATQQRVCFYFAPSSNAPFPPNPSLQVYSCRLARRLPLIINVCACKNKGHSQKGQT